MQLRGVNCLVPPENPVPAAPDGQEPGRPANGDWEMTGPVTDHVLTGTHGTGAERVCPGRAIRPGSVHVTGRRQEDGGAIRRTAGYGGGGGGVD